MLYYAGLCQTKQGKQVFVRNIEGAAPFVLTTSGRMADFVVFVNVFRTKVAEIYVVKIKCH